MPSLGEVETRTNPAPLEQLLREFEQAKQAKLAELDRKIALLQREREQVDALGGNGRPVKAKQKTCSKCGGQGHNARNCNAKEA